MPIRYLCACCRHPLKAPDGAADRLAKCPKCRTVGPVPADPPTLDVRADDTAEQPVPLFPSVPGELLPVAELAHAPPPTARPFRAGLAWGAGFWLTGLAVAAAAAGGRAAFLWAVG